jgi:hypothetical protein
MALIDVDDRHEGGAREVLRGQDGIALLGGLENQAWPAWTRRM